MNSPNLFRCVLLAYWVTIFALTHAPSLPSVPLAYGDKWMHMLVFAGLSFLLMGAFPDGSRWRGRRYYMGAAIILTYAAVDEWTQMFVQNRTGSLADWIADLMGVVIGLGAFSLWQWMRCLSPMVRRSPS